MHSNCFGNYGHTLNLRVSLYMDTGYNQVIWREIY